MGKNRTKCPPTPQTPRERLIPDNKRTKAKSGKTTWVEKAT